MASVPVWICGRDGIDRERLVSGITKRTTSREVVHSLLQYLREQEDGRDADQDALGVFEVWNDDCERYLSSRARIYKVWKAWGRERANVKFVVKKRGQKVQLAGSQEGMRRNSSSRGYRRSTSPQDSQMERRENQGRREVLAPPPEKGAHAKQSENLEKLEKIVNLVISNQNYLEDLAERIRLKDQQINQYETKIHMERLRDDGKDYVQNSYLSALFSSEQLGEQIQDAPLNNTRVDSDCDNQLIDSYLNTYERMLEIEESIEGQKESEAKIYRQVCEESYMLMAANNCLLDQRTGAEDDLRRQLDDSIREGARQRQEACRLESQLRNADSEVRRRKRELERLMAEQAEFWRAEEAVRDGGGRLPRDGGERLSAKDGGDQADDDSGCGSSQGDDRMSSSSIVAETMV